jgi:hypothetical protein
MGFKGLKGWTDNMTDPLTASVLGNSILTFSAANTTAHLDIIQSLFKPFKPISHPHNASP